MTLEERLSALEDAHRALAAQHTALIEITKLMLSITPSDPAYMQTAVTVLYDTIEELMQEHGQDDEYRADVRRWLDVLSRCALKGAHRPRLRHNPDAPAN